MPKYKSENVLLCTCRRNDEGIAEALRNLPGNELQEFLASGKAQLNISDETLESTDLGDHVLRKIKEDCAKQGFADQDELEEYFAEEYGRRIKPFFGEEIYALGKSKVITRKKRGGKFLIKIIE